MMVEEKILFVDDEESIRELATSCLTGVGYDLTTVASGEEALQACQREPFALMLTDLKMPGMSGEELVRRVKEVSPTTDAIIVTGYPTLESAVQALRAGAYDYVLKPFDLDDLEKTVQRCMEKRRLSRDLALERQLRQKLVESINERKRTETELLKAKEDAEAADRAKSEFLATMSHELRTPLNIITGYNDLLLERVFGDLTTEQIDTLQRTNKSAHDLLDLITAVLDISRLEAGRLPVEVKEVWVPDLLKEVEAETRGLHEYSNVEFEWRVEANLPLLDTDPGKLKVVIKNLIGNAVKFTKEGSISVGAHRNDGGVEINVVDTGIGIPEEALSVIFEPFQQVENSTTRPYLGSGLGLHIVKRLLELLGGTITVKSDVGRGSTFRVWLPAG